MRDREMKESGGERREHESWGIEPFLPLSACRLHHFELKMSILAENYNQVFEPNTVGRN